LIKKEFKEKRKTQTNLQEKKSQEPKPKSEARDPKSNLPKEPKKKKVVFSYHLKKIKETLVLTFR